MTGATGSDGTGESGPGTPRERDGTQSGSGELNHRGMEAPSPRVSGGSGKVRHDTASSTGGVERVEPLPAAFGGPGWRPRNTSLEQELGTHWASCGMDSEWAPLRAVLLHRPGPEVEDLGNTPGTALMLDRPDPEEMRRQHDEMAEAYRQAGVAIHYVDPPEVPSPNQLFSADLLAMTPQGAILARPASQVRAGEERWVARALGALGVPILRSVGGGGCFEGADLMWLTPGRVLLAQGLRTNAEGASQVATLLREQGVEVLETMLPAGTMHLMGTLRILDRELAVAWPGRLPEDAVSLLTESGFSVHFIPDTEEARRGFALNVVTLAPRQILMPAGNPTTESFYRRLGIRVIAVQVSELGKAAGSIGCLTGVLERESST